MSDLYCTELGPGSSGLNPDCSYTNWDESKKTVDISGCPNSIGKRPFGAVPFNYGMCSKIGSNDAHPYCEEYCGRAAPLTGSTYSRSCSDCSIDYEKQTIKCDTCNSEKYGAKKMDKPFPFSTCTKGVGNFNGSLGCQ